MKNDNKSSVILKLNTCLVTINLGKRGDLELTFQSVKNDAQVFWLFLDELNTEKFCSNLTDYWHGTTTQIGYSPHAIFIDMFNDGWFVLRRKERFWIEHAYRMTDDERARLAQEIENFLTFRNLSK